jgi:hypothetical protein
MDRGWPFAHAGQIALSEITLASFQAWRQACETAMQKFEVFDFGLFFRRANEQYDREECTYTYKHTSTDSCITAIIYNVLGVQVCR